MSEPFNHRGEVRNTQMLSDFLALNSIDSFLTIICAVRGLSRDISGNKELMDTSNNKESSGFSDFFPLFLF